MHGQKEIMKKNTEGLPIKEPLLESWKGKSQHIHQEYWRLTHKVESLIIVLSTSS